MGRVKKHKLKKSLVMRNAVSKRWHARDPAVEGRLSNDNVGNETPDSNMSMYTEVVRPSTSTEPGPSAESHVTQQSANTSGEEDDKPEVEERPRGFELVSRYRPTVNLDDCASVYCLMDLNLLKGFLAGLPCKFCLGTNTDVTYSNISSFVVEIKIQCKECDQSHGFVTSKSITDQSTKRNFSDINRRIVKTFSSLGKGHMAMETFCMGLNMPCMSHSIYDSHVVKVTNQVNLYTQESLKRARIEVIKAYSEIEGSLDHEGPMNIAVSYDGSWQKRGFTSKYGIGCIIEVITGLVVDYEVLSKYCRVCERKRTEINEESDEFEEWYLTHKHQCQANYEGSSPAMETEAAKRLWKRSEDLGFRYTSVISDGDSKTHDLLQSLNIYGEDIQIEKQECVNHVAKRLGTGLRNVVKVCANKKITLGGKSHGSLKGSTIDKLTKYYRNAIINNLDDIEAMKISIFATIDHCRSTDECPRHNKCPLGEESWCFYQRDLASGNAPRKHETSIKTPLNETVVKHILPLYIRLTDKDLLKRCSLGKTQNANEALHGLIWSKCPKTTFTAKRKVEAAVGEGISIYNEGYLLTITQLLSQVGLSSGATTASLARKRDMDRLRLHKARSTEKYRKYRKLLKSSKIREEESKKAREGKTYEAGGF